MKEFNEQLKVVEKEIFRALNVLILQLLTGLAMVCVAMVWIIT
tara:strand:+ start:2672 stop:2800 length:129 start_codon:yes stop_codon:yes gene_type:complete